MSKDNLPQDLSMLSAPFKALIGNHGLNYQFYDMLPTPIEIFTPDGTCIFVNRAWLELHTVPDASIYVGKYNYNDDPVCLEIMGQDVYDRVSRGEAVSFPDFLPPIQSAIDRGYINKKPYEAATMDLFFLPIWDGDVFTCTILFYTVKKMYYGKPEIAGAKKYIDEHWLDEFDEAAIAKAVQVSTSYLRLLFRNATGTTMFDYYKCVKVDRIKEKLADKDLNISQAFSFCGVDSRGWFGRLFKQLTGMTPKEYKESQK